MARVLNVTNNQTDRQTDKQTHRKQLLRSCSMGRHRGPDGVLFKLWPLANTRFRGTQSSVRAAWSTDNRWRTTAWFGRPLMALFARTRTAKQRMLG